MNIRDLLDVIKNNQGSEWSRIQAIEELAVIRRQEKQMRLEPIAHDMGELPGTETLKKIMILQKAPVVVRCQAAAALTETDNLTALDLCQQLIALDIGDSHHDYRDPDQHL